MSLDSTELRLLVSVFVTVFLAELGDKTQLATMVFSSRADNHRWFVFFAAASALVLACGIGVLLGGVLARFIDERTLNVVAGVAFIAIGIWVLLKG